MSEYSSVIRIPAELKPDFDELLDRYNGDKNRLLSDAIEVLKKMSKSPQVVDVRPICVPGARCQACEREAVNLVFFSNGAFSWRCEQHSAQA